MQYLHKLIVIKNYIHNSFAILVHISILNRAPSDAIIDKMFQGDLVNGFWVAPVYALFTAILLKQFVQRYKCYMLN